LGLVLFGIGSAWTARRVTRPLRGLVRASHRLGRGEYDTPIEHGSAHDEVGELARAFDHMRGNIAVQQQEIRQLAYWDRLTALPNRAQFRDAVIAAIAAGDPSRGALSVVMLDLDRFKHVNDVLGYAFGDRLLQAWRRSASAVVRDGDTVARLGGDEFALLLPGADTRCAAQEAAARIAKAFEVPLVLDDQTVDLSAGFGIACWPAHGADADTLLSRAEVAMYAAKRRTAGAQLYDAHWTPPARRRCRCCPSCAARWTRTSCACSCSPRWRWLRRRCAAPRRWCAGSTRCAAWCRRCSSSRSPSRPASCASSRCGCSRRWRAPVAALQPRWACARCRSTCPRATCWTWSCRSGWTHPGAPRRAGRAAFCLEITESAIMDDPQRAEATLKRLSERRLQAVDRRLRHRLFVAGLPEAAAGGRAQDRQELRDGMETRRRRREDRALDHRPGAQPGAERGGRGRRERKAQGYHLSRPMAVDAFTAWVAQRSLVHA
jgi:diguanylate cyclase (GGDEF)-like protein